MVKGINNALFPLSETTHPLLLSHFLDSTSLPCEESKMCHESPASSALALIITMIGSVFCIWHIYSFDHGACLIPSKREIFRCVVIVSSSPSGTT